MTASSGLVVAGFGRVSLVRTGDGRLVQARARSRQVIAVAGDQVELLEGDFIAAVIPRRNLVARSSAFRSKLIAANVSQVVLVVACEPPFSDELLCRALVAAQRAGAEALIVLNKIDLEAGREAAGARLAPFRAAGVAVLELAAMLDASPLLERLRGRRSVLIGQSGMGKSTLLKALVPEAEVRIREISAFLSSGKQSTTASRLYAIDAGTELIDTPGLSEFGLAGLFAQDIAEGFADIAPLAAQCRFRDCRHLSEPGCAVSAAAAAGALSARRLELYRRIVASP
ncbi:MAG: ribosome small subunit-dependent GTPase A [Betaproteobacteria bacterium]|nr:ribosome small subunit-dependent GTPase A [Betaproteobacteria bacterium]